MTHMMTAEGVNAAVETLDTSFLYDPPSRWMDSYRSLRVVDEKLKRQIKPYLWVYWFCLALAFALFAFLVAWSFSELVADPVIVDSMLHNPIFAATAWSAPAWLGPLGYWLSLRLAARRHPLVLLKSRIVAATRRFHALAGEPDPDDDA
jgi:hypothetical protein